MTDGRICYGRIFVERLQELPPRTHRLNPWESELSTVITAERGFVPVTKDLPACIHSHGKSANKLTEKIEGRVG